MNKFFRRAAMASLVTTASVAAMTAWTTADMTASAAQRNARGPAKASGPQVRAALGRFLNDAMKLTDGKDFAGALAKVKEADAAVMEKTPFEDYSIAKYLGFIAINQPMPDYDAATAAYNRQVASAGAPEAEQANMLSITMRLNYQAMQYANVIKNAADLVKFQPLDETGHLVLIQSYYNSNDYAGAIAAAKSQITGRVAGGMKPEETVLSLLLNAQLKNMDTNGARESLDQLAMISAKPEVWGQVMDFALGTQGINDHQLLNLYRLSILTGTMRDTDYLAMATIDLQSGLPSEAKNILTKANKTGELLDQAIQFLAGDQMALADLAAEADKQMNGEIDIKLGESYYTYGRYDDAVAAMRKGIQKGGIKDMADAQTTLGIALLAGGKKAEAVAEFEKAAATTGSVAQVAHVWALFGKRES